MKFGHHGANHPVQDLETGTVMITSQNHGFAVDESTLPDNVIATHRSLFDGTLQGIILKDCAGIRISGASGGESGAARSVAAVRAVYPGYGRSEETWLESDALTTE